MKILWAEKMAEIVNGSYESYVDDCDLKMVVRIYTPKGLYNCELEKLKRMIPKDFELIGISYCDVEKQIFLLINQK